MQYAIIDGKKTQGPGLPYFGESGAVGWIPMKDPENWIGVWLNGKFLGYRRAEVLPTDARRLLTNIVANVLTRLFKNLSGDEWSTQKTQL